MATRRAEMSSRLKEPQPSVGMLSSAIGLPNITTLLRADFPSLMQCLEQNNDVFSKTCIVELALTLVRFDATLQEPEKRAFVCAFDALVGRLVKDLHHFMEKETLLCQDVLFLRGLVKRCRMVEHMYICRSSDTAGRNTSGEEVKGKQNLLDLCDACAVNSSLLKFEHAVQGSMTSSATGVGKGNVKGQATPDVVGPITPLQQSVYFSPLPLKTLTLRGFPTRATLWEQEEFWEFVGGRLLKNDVAALMRMLQVRSVDGSSSSNVDDIQADVTCSGSVASTQRSGSNNNTIVRLGAHASSTEAVIPKHTSQMAEGNDSCGQGNGGSRMEEKTTTSSQFAMFRGNRFMIQTVVYLNLLIEGLLHWDPRALALPNAFFKSMKDLEQGGVVTESALESQRTGTANLDDIIGRPTPLPSPAALDLLRTLFPSLGSCAEDFAKLTRVVEETSGGVDGNSSSAAASDSSHRGLCSFQRLKGAVNNGGSSGSGTFGDNSGGVQPSAENCAMTSPSGPVHPADVVFFSLFRSFTRLDDDNVTSNTLPMRKECPPMVQTSHAEDAAATPREGPQEGEIKDILPYQIRVELERMIHYTQESITGVQSLQEQIREELTLLVFRAISSIVYDLLPAVQHVDQRGVIFYRKWLCDMYRLLWEEKLLERFSSKVAATRPEYPKDNISARRPSFRHARLTTTRCGGAGGARRQGGKGGLAATVSLPSPSQGTNRALSQREIGATVTTNEEGEEEREDVDERIAPGNAFSCAARRRASGNFEAASRQFLGLMRPSGLLDANAMVTAVTGVTDLSHCELELFDDPAVLVAELLLENASADGVPPTGFLVTRLMAALVRDGDTYKLRDFAFLPDRFLRGNVVTTPPPPPPLDPHPGTLRQTAFALQNARQPIRRKGLLSSQQLSGTTKTETLGSDCRSSTLQQQLGTRYPTVANAEDVKAQYYSVLSDAEMSLSPLDPIRAACVQNTVDYLITSLRNPKEAFELLDDYLDDVSIEPIQPFAAKCVTLDRLTDSPWCGATAEPNKSDGNVLSSSYTPPTINTVRCARQTTTSDGLAGVGGKARASHLGQATQAKRGCVLEKDGDTATVELSAFPNVIPSWNTQEENEQFLLILAVLRREYMNLQTELGIAQSVSTNDNRDVLSK